MFKMFCAEIFPAYQALSQFLKHFSNEGLISLQHINNESLISLQQIDKECLISLKQINNAHFISLQQINNESLIPLQQINNESLISLQQINESLISLQQSWSAYLCCRESVNYSNHPELLNTVGKLIVHLLGDEAMNPYQGMYSKCPEISYTKVSDKMAYTNSADTDQTAPEGAV